MKNWLTQVVTVAFAVVALVSCKKDEEKVTVTPSNGITLTASGSAVVLAQVNAAQAAITYNWTPVSSFVFSGTDQTTAPAVSYQLQVAKSADGFGYPTPIDAGAGAAKTITVGDLNITLLGLGLVPGVATPVFVRVVAVVGTDAHTFASNTLSLTATAYRVCLPPDTDTWGLVGPAGDGWPGATATDRPMTWDCDARAYVLRTTLKAGDFKFRRNRDWAVNLGALVKPITPGATAITLKPGGEDMTVTTPGTYTIKLVVDGSGAAVTGGTLTVTP